MWWEADAIALLTGQGVTREVALGMVHKVKVGDDFTPSEAGMWAKVVTMLGGAAVLALAARPLVRPSTNAEVIRMTGDSFSQTLRTAMGHREICGKEVWYPAGGRWSLVSCPLTKGHKGLHADANLVPFFTDEDAAFFNRQHALATEV